jgi:hypothetical protein
MTTAYRMSPPDGGPASATRLRIITRTLTGERMEAPVERASLDPGAAVPGGPDGRGEFRPLARQLAATVAARENSPRAT